MSESWASIEHYQSVCNQRTTSSKYTFPKFSKNIVIISIPFTIE